ncbi:MAG: hypothetical protein GX638_12645, partial [Crenarchaeota archaeon]|nr:hypothetical protein [Thermoproteota archaeon]
MNDSISYVDYDSDINEFKNTGLSSITVRTIAQETLVGVAAGYSDGNIYNVAIESPSIDIATDYASAYSDLLTENLSDFGVVGYTTKQGQISKVDNKIYGVNITSEIEFNAATDGTAEGWGGSVDMYDMYSRLLGVWNNFNSTHTSGGTDEFKYYTNEEITINPDGSTTINSQSGATNNRLWSSEDGTFLTGYNYYHGYYGYKQYDSDDGNKETSSYTFVIEESSGDDAYMQLSGKKEVKIPGATKTLKTNYWEDFTGKKVYVDINSTRYYLATNGTNDVTSITNEANASFWEYENNYIFTNIDGIAYYLNRSGSTVILSSSANTKWEFNSSEGGYYTHDNGTNYYLNCTITDWNLVNPSTVGYVTLSNGSGRYITHTTNNGNTSTGTDGNRTEARWYIAGDYFKTAATGTAYYLRNNYTSSVSLNGTASQNNLYVSSSTSSRFVYKDGYLYANYFNSSGLLHHVYGYVSSNAWRRTIATGTANPPSNRTLVTVTKTEDTLNSNGAKNITFGSQTGMQINTKKNRTEIVDASFTTNHTYFPLRQKTDNPGVPDDTNTGYVVSGSGYYGDPYGDIRVSRYSKSGYLSSGTYNA